MVFYCIKKQHIRKTLRNMRTKKTLKTILCIIFLLMGTSSCAESRTVTETGDSLMLLLENRRSIRRYTSERIDRQTLDYIMKAGAFAPSSYGQNPVEFIVVEDMEKLKDVARAKRIGAPSVRNAAAAIIVVADTSKGELWVEDSSVAAGYILLAAVQKGIGACWNQIRDRDGQRLSASDEIKEILDQTGKMSDEDLKTAVKQVAAEYGLVLTDSEMNRIVRWCRRLENLNMDSIVEQVGQIQETVGKVSEAKDKVVGFAAKVHNFFVTLSGYINTIRGWFGK